MDPNNGFSPWGSNNRRTVTQKSKQKNQNPTAVELGNRTSASPLSAEEPKSSSPINCRSSPSHVAAVMSKFDDRNRDLVKSIAMHVQVASNILKCF